MTAIEESLRRLEDKSWELKSQIDKLELDTKMKEELGKFDGCGIWIFAIILGIALILTSLRLEKRINALEKLTKIEKENKDAP